MDKLDADSCGKLVACLASPFQFIPVSGPPLMPRTPCGLLSPRCDSELRWRTAFIGRRGAAPAGGRQGVRRDRPDGDHAGQPAAAVFLGLRRDPAPDRRLGRPRRHGAVPGSVRDDPREAAEGGLPAAPHRSRRALAGPASAEPCLKPLPTAGRPQMILFCSPDWPFAGPQNAVGGAPIHATPVESPKTPPDSTRGDAILDLVSDPG